MGNYTADNENGQSVTEGDDWVGHSGNSVATGECGVDVGGTLGIFVAGGVLNDTRIEGSWKNATTASII